MFTNIRIFTLYQLVRPIPWCFNLFLFKVATGKMHLHLAISNCYRNVGGSCGKGLLFHELLAIRKEEDNKIPNRIVICAPEDLPGADSDRDSDLSDEEALGDMGYLPARLLRSQVIPRYTEDRNQDNPNIESDEPSAASSIAPDPPPKRKKKPSVPLNWQKRLSSKVL